MSVPPVRKALALHRMQPPSPQGAELLGSSLTMARRSAVRRTSMTLQSNLIEG